MTGRRWSAVMFIGMAGLFSRTLTGVALSTDRPAYAEGAPIAVRLSNEGKRDVFYAEPFEVERKEGERWVPVPPPPPKAEEPQLLMAERTEPYELLQARSGVTYPWKRALPPGATYRFKTRVYPENRVGAPPTEILSNEFDVKGTK